MWKGEGGRGGGVNPVVNCEQLTTTQSKQTKIGNRRKMYQDTGQVIQPFGERNGEWKKVFGETGRQVEEKKGMERCGVIQNN